MYLSLHSKIELIGFHLVAFLYYCCKILFDILDYLHENFDRFLQKPRSFDLMVYLLFLILSLIIIVHVELEYG